VPLVRARERLDARCLMRLVVLISFLVVLVVAAPAGAAVAPGRVTFSVGAPEPQRNVDAGGASAAVALPDGGAVLIAPEFGRGFVAARLRADGSLEPSFGSGGVAHVAVPMPAVNPTGLQGPFTPLQVLRQADGKLLAVGSGPPRTKYELGQALLVRLTADGALDMTFGEGGVARPAFQASCGGLCQPASLQADGSIVVAGSTGSVSPVVERDPNAPATFQWIVARLTAAGGLDPGFGRGGVVEVPSAVGRGAAGFATAVLGDGRIVAFGRDANVPLLARLLPSGALDGSFHGGVPVALPIRFSIEMLVHPDGFVDVVGDQRLVRYRPDGEPDPGFGAAGVLDVATPVGVPRLLGLAGRAVLLYVGVGFDPRPTAQGDVLLRRIMSDGRFDPSTGGAGGVTVRLGFGGGVAGRGVTRRPQPLPPLRQTSFMLAQALQRPDGSLLVVGGVRVVRSTGEGAGLSTGLFAAAALAPGLALNPSFGGAATPPRLRVRVAEQRAITAARLRRIALRVGASAPGLALIRARARGRVVAEGLEPLFTTGTSTVRLPVTRAGGRVLRRGGRVRVTVTAQARDLVAQRATVRARGTLLR